MKHNKHLKRLIIGLFVLGTFILASCQDFVDYLQHQFPEVDSTTYVVIDGTIMAPLVNSTKYIKDLLPKSQDSTFYIYVDKDSLLHITMSMDSVISLTGTDLGVSISLPSGTFFGPVPLPPIFLEQNLPSLSDISGEFAFGALEINLFIKNSLPVSIDGNIDSVIFINTNTDEELKYHPDIDFNLSASDGSGYVVDTVTLDTVNFPHLGDALRISPNKVDVVISGNIPRQTLQNSFEPNMDVNFDMVADVPLYFYAKDIVLSDTVNIDLPLEDSIIQDILVKAVADNDIPLGGKVYMAIVDSIISDTIAVLVNPDFSTSTDTMNIFVGTKLVSLRPVIDLAPAETDMMGIAIMSSVSTSKIHLSRENIKNLQNYNGKPSILLFARFNTYNSSDRQFVRILASNYINIKLGAKVEYATSF